MKERLQNIDPVTLSRLVFALVFGITLSLAGSTWYFYNQAKKNNFDPQVLSAKVKENPLTLLDAVGQLIELPKGEDPAIATVTDPNKLDNEFFKDAQSGDKVIVFSKSQLAILYRPSTNKIIKAGPGIYQAPTPEPFVAATESSKLNPSPKVLLNPIRPTTKKTTLPKPTVAPTTDAAPTP